VTASSSHPLTEPADAWFDGYGIRIHGLDWGGPPDGPLVLLLHGVGGNAWIWDDVAPRLRRAVPGHRVVAIDQRDGGDTDHPPSDYSREAFTADVVAVARALSDRPIILVGHSRGGWLASWIAAVEPGLVERLVLVDPARLAFADDGAADTFFAWVNGSLGPFDDAEAAVAWAADQDRHATWSPVRRRSFLAGLRTAEDGRLVGKLPRGAVDRLKDARADAAAVTAAVADLDIPTLLLVADRQSSERRADKLRYADLIRGVTTVPIGGSHFLHTDAPGPVADAIATFVSGARAPG
jgi:pimeloyl-ACP methyl ester carboxylesterase